MWWCDDYVLSLKLHNYLLLVIWKSLLICRTIAWCRKSRPYMPPPTKVYISSYEVFKSYLTDEPMMQIHANFHTPVGRVESCRVESVAHLSMRTRILKWTFSGTSPLGWVQRLVLVPSVSLMFLLFLCFFVIWSVSWSFVKFLHIRASKKG